jgi:hypothetical protein
MTGRVPQIIDARGLRTATSPRDPSLPPHEDLAPDEPAAELLTNEPVATSNHAPTSYGTRRRRNNKPIAAMPNVDAATRKETRTLDVYHVIDVSPSNAWNDPENARFHDFAFLARKWAATVIPDDRFIQVLFDSQAVAYPAVAPREVPRDGWSHRPTPTRGGTCFLPPAQAVADCAARFPGHAALAIWYSDGMPSSVNDIAHANAVLKAAGISAVLIPYGFEFPWISAHWEHTAFRIAAHVDDRRRAIAQTVALAIVEAAGFKRLA